jgi:hypothetical protein
MPIPRGNSGFAEVLKLATLRRKKAEPIGKLSIRSAPSQVQERRLAHEKACTRHGKYSLRKNALSMKKSFKVHTILVLFYTEKV